MAGSADDERAIVDPLHMASRGGARAQMSHACKVCGAEFPSGVSRGGHMRKHYVPTKRPTFLSPAELALASSLQRWAPPSPEEAPIVAAPPPPQVPAGCVRLFGVNIIVQQPKEEEAPVNEQ